MDNLAPTHAWMPQSPWHGIAAAGQYGQSGSPGITVELRNQIGMATLIAADQDDDALAVALENITGLVLPRRAEMKRHGDCRIIWNGPAQWLLLTDTQAAFDRVRKGLAGIAAFIDQSNSRAMLSISGHRVRDVLAKGVMVNLHPRAFPEGAVALTSVAHIAIVFWRCHDGPDGAVFEIAVPRSMAGSFWSWLRASAAEFGMNVSLQK